MDISNIELIDLKELLTTLDALLLNVTEQIEASCNKDSDHLYEKGEYFIGVGFCAMQRFLFVALQDKEIEASEARKLGPVSLAGTPVAQLIHSAANYWKHSPEWHIWQEELSSHSQRTADKMLNGRESAHYPLADLLVDLCGDNILSLSQCVPYLGDWRKAVNKNLEENV